MAASDTSAPVIPRHGLRRLGALLALERPRPRWVRTLPNGWMLAVGTVCFGAFMGQLDASIATLTYPALTAQFHARLAGVEWVSLSYLLTLVALLVPVGRLSDAYGRKLFYLYGFIVFTAGSAACGFAPSLLVLIVFRVLQAAGAALLQANSVALVTTSAPREKMRAALGIQAGAQALGLALGPTLGGLIVTGLGWRWVFFVNLPVGAVAVVSGLFLLPRTRTRNSAAGFDWPGLGLLAVATTSLLLGISAASGLGLDPFAVAGLFVVCAASAWGFARRIGAAANPLVDPLLLRSRQISAGLGGALGGYLVLFGPLTLVPIVLSAAGMSLAGAGLILTALPAGFAFGALSGDRIVPTAWPDRRRACAGSALALAAAAATVPCSFTPGQLVPLLALLGVGLGLFTPPNNTLVMGAIPASAAGTGGGLVNMTRGLGTALGVAAVTLALHVAGSSDRLLGARIAAGVLAGVGALVFASNFLHPRRPEGSAAPGVREPLEL